MKKLSKKIKITLISCISILSLGVIAGTASGITLASYDRTKPLLADNEFGTDYDLRVETKYGENNSNTNYLRGEFNGVTDDWNHKIRLTQLESAGYYGAIVTFAVGDQWKLWQDNGTQNGIWLNYVEGNFSEGAGYVKEAASYNNNEMITAGTYIFSFNSTSSKISLVKIS